MPIQVIPTTNIITAKAQLQNGMIQPTIISVLSNFESTQTTFCTTTYGLLFATVTSTGGLDKRSIYILWAKDMQDNAYNFTIIKTFNYTDNDLFYPSITQINKGYIVVAFTVQTDQGYRIAISYTSDMKGTPENFTWSPVTLFGTGNVSYVHPAIINNNGNISLIYAANYTGVFNLYELELNTSLYVIKNETQITNFNTNVLQPRVLVHAGMYYMTFVKDNDQQVNSTDYDIYITSSTDMYNWTEPVIAAENDEDANHNDLMPSLYISDDGIFTIYFESETLDGHKIYSASSADGKTWPRPKQFWLNGGVDPLIGKDLNGQLFLMFSEGYPIQQLQITRQIFTISTGTPKINVNWLTISISLSDVDTNEPGYTINDYTDLKVICNIYEVPPGLTVSNRTDVDTLTNISTVTLTHDTVKDVWTAELSTLNFERGNYVVKVFFISENAQGASPISLSFEVKIDRQLIYFTIIGIIAITGVALWFRHIRRKER